MVHVSIDLVYQMIAHEMLVSSDVKQSVIFWSVTDELLTVNEIFSF